MQDVCRTSVCRAGGAGAGGSATKEVQAGVRGTTPQHDHTLCQQTRRQPGHKIHQTLAGLRGTTPQHDHTLCPQTRRLTGHQIHSDASCVRPLTLKFFVKIEFSIMTQSFLSHEYLIVISHFCEGNFC